VFTQIAITTHDSVLLHSYIETKFVQFLCTELKSSRQSTLIVSYNTRLKPCLHEAFKPVQDLNQICVNTVIQIVNLFT